MMMHVLSSDLHELLKLPWHSCVMKPVTKVPVLHVLHAVPLR